MRASPSPLRRSTRHCTPRTVASQRLASRPRARKHTRPPGVVLRRLGEICSEVAGPGWAQRATGRGAGVGAGGCGRGWGRGCGRGGGRGLGRCGARDALVLPNVLGGGVAAVALVGPLVHGLVAEAQSVGIDHAERVRAVLAQGRRLGGGAGDGPPAAGLRRDERAHLAVVAPAPVGAVGAGPGEHELPALLADVDLTARGALLRARTRAAALAPLAYGDRHRVAGDAVRTRDALRGCGGREAERAQQDRGERDGAGHRREGTLHPTPADRLRRSSGAALSPRRGRARRRR